MLAAIKETLRDSFNLKNDIAEPEEIQREIEAGAKVKGTNMCILILAILIASIGLNMNSTAVIIGAMLISPLMGGIIAIGYGIAVNDLSASKRAAIGLIFQIIICIITSTVYFSLSPISAAHSEILARTNPSIWDVLIAIAGGLAGIIGITRKEKSNVIPGVAIATALMPPLCTAGYGLAQGNIKYFLGAMYLFFINSFFICISTIVIIKILKLPCKEMIDEKAKKKLYRNMTFIAVITVIPSIFLAFQLISESFTNSNIKQFIAKELNSGDTQVIQYEINEETDTLEIAILGNQLSKDDIEQLESSMQNYSLGNLALKITQPSMDGVITADDLKNYLDKDEEKIALAIKDNEIAGLKDKLDKKEKELDDYKKHDYDMEEMKKELNALYPDIKSFSVGIQKSIEDEPVDEEGDVPAVNPEDSPEKETLLVVLNTSSHINDEDMEKIKAWFAAKTSEENIAVIEQTEEE